MDTKSRILKSFVGKYIRILYARLDVMAARTASRIFKVFFMCHFYMSMMVDDNKIQPQVYFTQDICSFFSIIVFIVKAELIATTILFMP